MRTVLPIGLLLCACQGSSPPPPAAASTEQPVAAPSPKEAPAKTAAVAKSAAPAKAPTPAPPPPPPIPDDMALVPAGTFTMGADDEGEQDERPAHKVTLEAFLLDKLEVTNGDYNACVKAGVCRAYRGDVAKSMKYGSEREFRGDRQPVVGVSWFDAKKYCEHKGKRLPREAEWERAARGDESRHYVWGADKPDATRGCYSASCGGKTADVGSYPAGAGPYGHLDLAGNVWEWVEDEYDPYAYKRDTAAKGVPGNCDQILAAQDELRRLKQQGYTGTNPIPHECERVLRGGAFNYRGDGLRASNRVHHPGGWRILVAGFRCAKDYPSAASGEN